MGKMGVGRKRKKKTQVQALTIKVVHKQEVKEKKTTTTHDAEMRWGTYSIGAA